MAFDLDKAVIELIANSEKGSTGRCARYVRLALVAGGIDMTGNPVSAKEYGPFLLLKKFKTIPSIDIDKGAFSKGDVVVIEPYKGGGAHGHIAMFSGKAWISDFTQTDMWGGPGYRKNKPTHAVYRYSEDATALISRLPTSAAAA